MLFDLSDTGHSDNPSVKLEAASTEVASLYDFKGIVLESLKNHLGNINKDVDTHFVTNGRWSMPDLMFWVLNLIGPASLKIATWSISQNAINRIVVRKQKGLVHDVQFLLDPRVKVRNPNPLAMVKSNFPYKLIANHAKFTIFSNENYKVVVGGSANLTNNPRIEIGWISFKEELFDFYTNTFNHAFDQGTT